MFDEGLLDRVGVFADEGAARFTVDVLITLVVTQLNAAEDLSIVHNVGFEVYGRRLIETVSEEITSVDRARTIYMESIVAWVVVVGDEVGLAQEYVGDSSSKGEGSASALGVEVAQHFEALIL